MVEGQTKSLSSALVEILVLLPMGGRTNQATSKCLGQNLSHSIYGWKDEPSHSRVPWQNLSLPALGWKDEPSHLQMPW